MQISKIKQNQNFGKVYIINKINSFPQITPTRQKFLDKITRNFYVMINAGRIELNKPHMLYLREASVITIFPRTTTKAKMPIMSIKRTFNSDLSDNQRFLQLVKTIKDSISTYTRKNILDK